MNAAQPSRLGWSWNSTQLSSITYTRSLWRSHVNPSNLENLVKVLWYRSEWKPPSQWEVASWTRQRPKLVLTTFVLHWHTQLSVTAVDEFLVTQHSVSITEITARIRNLTARATRNQDRVGFAFSVAGRSLEDKSVDHWSFGRQANCVMTLN